MQYQSDERFAVKIDEMVSLPELCRELSISAATGRNWVKLGKLVPSASVKGAPYFTRDYVRQLKTDIRSGRNTSLKSRRNKKYVSGNNIYGSYLSEDSANIPVVQSVIDLIERKGIEITEDVLFALLADCAVKLIISKTSDPVDPGDGFPGYLAGKYKENQYMFLVDDLLINNPSSISVTEEHPELFEARYVHEEGEDIPGFLYISLKSIGSRKATGSYYTPTKVVKKLCDRLFALNGHAEKTILDPCCGTGNFIIQLPQTIDYRYVFGSDIDSVSVKIARINYALKYMISDKDVIYSHITERDFLSFSSDTKFDYIIGNPPWGYDFSETEKNELRQRYSSAIGSNIESYDVFIEQALRNLSHNGVLSFVLPEAFLNVKMHTPVRRLLLKSNSIQYIEYLGNTFSGVQCPCVILQVRHTNRPFSSAGMIVNDGKREFIIRNDRTVNAACLSFTMTDEEYEIINKLDNVQSKETLKGQAIFALGIVTGSNGEYIYSEKRDDNEMVLRGSDLRRFRFRDSGSYLVFRPESFQQAAPVEYYRAGEKLLYRFICSQLVFAYDNRQTLSLNSCNILIPRIDGLSMKYIMAVLNSRAAQFYFQKRFRSVKVLRSHIEQIPIPRTEKEAQDRIVSLVDAILEASENSVIADRYDELDAEIAGLYGLNGDEYHLIVSSMEDENLYLF